MEDFGFWILGTVHGSYLRRMTCDINRPDSEEIYLSKKSKRQMQEFLPLDAILAEGYLYPESGESGYDSVP